MIGQYGHYGDPDTIEEAKKRFRDHVDGTTSLPADLKGAVFSLALANGDETTFDQLVQVGVGGWVGVRVCGCDVCGGDVVDVGGCGCGCVCVVVGVGVGGVCIPPHHHSIILV